MKIIITVIYSMLGKILYIYIHTHTHTYIYTHIFSFNSYCVIMSNLLLSHFRDDGKDSERLKITVITSLRWHIAKLSSNQQVVLHGIIPIGTKRTRPCGWVLWSVIRDAQGWKRPWSSSLKAGQDPVRMSEGTAGWNQGQMLKLGLKWAGPMGSSQDRTTNFPILCLPLVCRKNLAKE